MGGPLEGIKVVDLTRYQNGPHATAMLSDMGADVLKAEPVGEGDMCRAWGPFDQGIGCFFLSVNRNKKSIVLDARSDQGRADMAALIASADVFVTNQPPSVQKKLGMAVIFITHDMGVVAETAERVSVQYAGQKIEEQQVLPLFREPHHPYTAALLDALPERATEKRLPTIPGVVPGQFDRPAGCLFSPRCKFANDKCRAENPPPLSEDLGKARCFYPLNTDERVAS